jgi:UDP-glucose 4-epimerase
VRGFPKDLNEGSITGDNTIAVGVGGDVGTYALIRAFHEQYGLDYVALRYFNVYGPRMDVHGLYTEVLVRWMERIEAGEPPLILGDGLQTMDFVYIGDVARARRDQGVGEDQRQTNQTA